MTHLTFVDVGDGEERSAILITLASWPNFELGELLLGASVPLAHKLCSVSIQGRETDYHDPLYLGPGFISALCKILGPYTHSFSLGNFAIMEDGPES